MSSHAIVLPSVAWLLGVNVATALAFSADKRAAIAGRRRIPEARLLWLAALGGSPAAFRARRRYRHKTRKQPFTLILRVIATVQAGLALGWALGLATLLF